MSDTDTSARDVQKNKHALGLKKSDWDEIFNYLRRRPQTLFFSRDLRVYIAKKRAGMFASFQRTASNPSGKAIDITIPHNKRMMDNFVESHVERLIRPLSVIDPVYEKASNMRVLSIGPRNEMEIFNLIAHGFHPENISAIDQVSNSPLIDIGDMHAIPHPDNSFDVMINGWALPYSTDHQTAVNEMCRILKPGGLFCIGFTRIPPGTDEFKRAEADGGINNTHSDDILRLIGEERIDEVAFRHDPLDKSRKGVILLIVRLK
ncbi:MAG: class I SAM-dependent methyltransferase [Nisaea sp.]|jgi:SAM-dependent methyltransferase|uniref:class I SAM-dependent methyltransferase n=1 Tax=Nisaea sp. TaxID=2024842 RepID=UPI001B2D84EB|nr:class I SAM-dependent methyltransferase [Nisaea sp.]MBO6562231.1 class I SAM-dependent methyltransferase [Nisaea sp.]